MSPMEKDLIVRGLIIALQYGGLIQRIETSYRSGGQRDVTIELRMIDPLPVVMWTTAMREIIKKFFGLPDDTPENQVFERAMIWFGERGRIG